jgi:hypothetical protein
MRRVLGTCIILGAALSCFAIQFQVPLGQSSPSEKTVRVTTHTLTGTVLDKNDKPVPNAVVYLKNKKTLAVKTFIAGDDGTFHFPELSPNVDYEIYAQKDGYKSDTKLVSQFDDRQKVNINLRINMNK